MNGSNRRWRGPCGWVVIVSGLVLSLSCRHAPTPPEPTPPVPASLDTTMSLWTTYLDCRHQVQLEPRKGAALVLLDRAESQSPPDVERWRRRSVSLQALAASCSLLVGAEMIKSGETQQAQILYQRVLDQPPLPELATYKMAAQRVLTNLVTSSEARH